MWIKELKGELFRVMKMVCDILEIPFMEEIENNVV
jgi:hypothetical protein